MSYLKNKIIKIGDILVIHVYQTNGKLVDLNSDQKC